MRQQKISVEFRAFAYLICRRCCNYFLNEVNSEVRRTIYNRNVSTDKFEHGAEILKYTMDLKTEFPPSFLRRENNGFDMLIIKIFIFTN